MYSLIKGWDKYPNIYYGRQSEATTGKPSSEWRGTHVAWAGWGRGRQEAEDSQRSLWGGGDGIEIRLEGCRELPERPEGLKRHSR